MKDCKKLVIDNNGELIYVEKDSIQCTVCGEWKSKEDYCKNLEGKVQEIIMEPNDVCENCIGWGESCLPDWYPDYCDPNAGLACSGYEAKAYKVTYEKYNNSEFKDCQFFSTIEEAEAFKERFSKLSHISNIRITTAST